MKSFQLEIVSPEASIFSGRAQKLFVTGIMGDLEILCGHAPLLTSLAPGSIWVVGEDGQEDGLVIFGGMLEVQPEVTIVLADAVMRAKDIDEAAAAAAKVATETAITNREHGLDYQKAHLDLTLVTAQLHIMQKLHSLKK